MVERNPTFIARALMDSKMVLVVDDQPLMVKLITAVLETAGFEVRGTVDPDAAIEMAELLRESVQLLITDMRMTNMTGQELATRVERHCPDLPVIFISGDTPEEFSFVADDRHLFLRKPFRNQALIDCVRTLIGG
jgi:FixJ family two-component response regulator